MPPASFNLPTIPTTLTTGEEFNFYKDRFIKETLNNKLLLNNSEEIEKEVSTLISEIDSKIASGLLTIKESNDLGVAVRKIRNKLNNKSSGLFKRLVNQRSLYETLVDESTSTITTSTTVGLNLFNKAYDVPTAILNKVEDILNNTENNLRELENKGNSIKEPLEKAIAESAFEEIKKVEEDSVALEPQVDSLFGVVNTATHLTKPEAKIHQDTYAPLDNQRKALKNTIYETIAKLEKAISDLEPISPATSATGSDKLPASIKDPLLLDLRKKRADIVILTNPTSPFGKLNSQLNLINRQLKQNGPRSATSDPIGKLEKSFTAAEFPALDTAISAFLNKAGPGSLTSEFEATRLAAENATRDSRGHLERLKPSIEATIPDINNAKTWNAGLSSSQSVLTVNIDNLTNQLNSFKRDIDNFKRNNPGVYDLRRDEFERRLAELEEPQGILTQLKNEKAKIDQVYNTVAEAIAIQESPSRRMNLALDSLLNQQNNRLQSKAINSPKQGIIGRFWQKFRRDNGTRAAVGAGITIGSSLAAFVPLGSVIALGGRMLGGAIGGAMAGDSLAVSHTEAGALKVFNEGNTPQEAIDELMKTPEGINELEKSYHTLTGVASQKGLAINQVFVQADLDKEALRKKNQGLFGKLRDGFSKQPWYAKMAISGALSILGFATGPGGVIASGIANGFLASARPTQDVYRTGYQHSDKVLLLGEALKKHYGTLTLDEKQRYLTHTENRSEDRERMLINKQRGFGIAGALLGAGTVWATSALKDHFYHGGSSNNNSRSSVDNASGGQTHGVAGSPPGSGHTPFEQNQIKLHLKTNPLAPGEQYMPDKTGVNANLHIAQEILKTREDYTNIGSSERHQALVSLMEKVNQAPHGHFNADGSVNTDVQTLPNRLVYDIDAVKIRNDTFNNLSVSPEVIKTENFINTHLGTTNGDWSSVMNRHHGDALFMAVHSKLQNGGNVTDQDFHKILDSLKDKHSTSGYTSLGAKIVHQGQSVTPDIHKHLQVHRNHSAHTGGSHHRTNSQGNVIRRNISNDPGHDGTDIARSSEGPIRQNSSLRQAAPPDDINATPDPVHDTPLFMGADPVLVTPERIFRGSDGASLNLDRGLNLANINDSLVDTKLTHAMRSLLWSSTEIGPNGMSMPMTGYPAPYAHVVQKIQNFFLPTKGVVPDLDKLNAFKTVVQKTYEHQPLSNNDLYAARFIPNWSEWQEKIANHGSPAYKFITAHLERLNPAENAQRAA